MHTAKPGDLVSVIYEGCLDNNEIFESANDTGPLKFTIGAGQVLPDFEKNIIGMAAGESKEFTLPPEVSHGPHDPNLVHTIQRQGLKQGQDIKVGMVLAMNMEKEGKTHQVPAMVTGVGDETITVDFNHPLAGKELTYKVTLQSING